ncbi:MAG: hypothetical protein ACTS5Y_00645 [Pollutimonas bauzanensis]|uniref:SCP-2 sterol transfer family protein n=1 Tax=Pollutimonas bauzanensis TaxID=658167 RepID=A0A1M5QU99_9BURK|nr:hypothetical protein [Pollutimonas bauzanensis]SHH17685.1 hypothetical protein SAMN04488135_102383 [Pollutimonas bauzanensis]
MTLEERILLLLPERANSNEHLLWRGRHLSASVLLQVGAQDYLLRIREGRVAGVARGPFIMPNWQFALRADEHSWTQFWRALPPPGYNDLFAMAKAQRLRIEGDLYPLMSNLLYFKDLLASIRLSEGDQ